jgi:hypothetical protein
MDVCHGGIARGNVAKMFDWHVRHTQEGITAVERAISTRQRAVEILKDYEFKADKVMPNRGPAGHARFEAYR